MITCKLQSGQRHPNCKYGKGKKSTRYIVLKCDEDWPVHYEKDIIHSSNPIWSRLVTALMFSLLLVLSLWFATVVDFICKSLRIKASAK